MSRKSTNEKQKIAIVIYVTSRWSSESWSEGRHIFYFIKPNDNIIVNPNNPKVKSAGFVGNVGTILTIASLALSITILLTR